jgi:hypothetical protein
MCRCVSRRPVAPTRVQVNRFALFSGRVQKASQLFDMHYDRETGNWHPHATGKLRLEMWLIAQQLRLQSGVHPAWLNANCCSSSFSAAQRWL